MTFNNYKLSKWSRLIRLRDKATCQMCNCKPGVFKLHAHHIYPKHYTRYHKKAYILLNGISLCSRCHKRVVHTSNRNWKRFTGMFRQYQNRKLIKEFNTLNQYKTEQKIK